MAFDFKVNFTGLCLHHLPGWTPDEDPVGDQNDGCCVLVVDATGSGGGPGLHEDMAHQALLTFDPRDIQGGRPPKTDKIRYGRDVHGDRIAWIDLKDGYDVYLGSGQADRPFRVERGRPRRNRRPVRSGRRNVGWLASLHDTHQDIVGLKDECFQGFDLVQSRFHLTAGKLRAGRIGMVGDVYGVWAMDPSENVARHEVVQALADRAELEVENLKERPVELYLKAEEESDSIRLCFDPQDRDVEISISNLPVKPGVASAELHHFRWFYPLVRWRDGAGSSSSLPIPKLVDPVMAGGNLLCPSATYP
jgi:hypothetical protein